MKRKKTFFFLLITILLLGCSYKTKEVPETTLILGISATLDINEIGTSSAAPLQTRLYELSSVTLFEQADFLDIYLLDSSTLQDSLVMKHPLPTIQPGEHRTLNLQLDDATRYIAILAEFANYKSAGTKAVYAVQSGANNQVRLSIEGNHIKLDGTKNQK